MINKCVKDQAPTFLDVDLKNLNKELDHGKNYVPKAKNQYLFHCFLSIKDPRVPGRCIYPLINILLITLCALICGVDTWKGLPTLGKKLSVAQSIFGDTRWGVPNPLTFARVFNLNNSNIVCRLG